MSLNYNLTKIERYKDLLNPEGHEEAGMPSVGLKSMIFATMAIGMGTIKDEKEALEFFTRLSFYEKAVGAFRSKLNEKGGEFEPVYFTLDEVKRCIGLSTDVFPTLSEAAFLKSIYQGHKRDVAWAARKAEEKAA